MKKLIASILIMALFMTCVPTSVSAEVKTYDNQAKTLYDIGLFNGRTGAGTQADFDLLGTTNRQEAMKMIVVLLGLPLVTNEACPFSDVDTWAQPYVTTAYQAGITKGLVAPTETKKGTYGAKKQVTAHEYTTWILRALGYDLAESWNNTAMMSYNAGLLNIEESADMVEAIAKKQENGLLRNDLVHISYNALTCKKVKTDKKLIELLYEESKLSAQGVQSAESYGYIQVKLKVVSVAAIGLREVAVKYNRPIADENMKAEYYAVISDNLHNLITKVTKSSNTVILSLGTSVKKQGTAVVSVNKLVGLEQDYSTTLTNIIDAQPPSVTTITFVSPKRFEIKSSEPLDPKSVGTVLINNGQLAVGAIEVKDNSIFVDIPNRLVAGTYDIKMMGFMDYAGLAFANPIQLVTYAPTVQTISAMTEEVVDRNAVVVTFNVPIATTLTPDYFYHYSDMLKPDSVTKISDKSYKLNFITFPLKTGVETLTIKSKVNDKAIEDEWGNQLIQDYAISLTVKEDLDSPKVISSEQADDSSLRIYFSEEIYTQIAENKANYVVVGTDGKSVTTDLTVKYTKDYVNKKFYSDLKFNTRLLDGTYTVKLMGFVDASMNKNVLINNEVSLLVKDILPPTVTKVEYVQTPAYNYVYVTYSEAMSFNGTGSILDKNNYLYNNAKLPYEAVVETFQGVDQIRIVLPATFTIKAGVDLLTTSYVKDANGNIMQPTSKAVVDGMSNKPKITSAYTTSLNTMVVVIDSKLPQVLANGFKYKLTSSGSDLTPAMVGYSYKDNTTIVTLTMAQGSQLADSQTVPYSVAIISGVMVDYKSITLDATPFTQIVDKIGPTYVTNSLSYSMPTQEVSNLLMNLTFDENLGVVSGMDPSFGAFDLEIKVNGVTLTAIQDYSIIIGGKVLSINLKTGGKLSKIKKGDNVIITCSDPAHYLSDGTSNVIKSFTLTETLK